MFYRIWCMMYMMRIQIKTKNFDLTESIAAYIEERVGSIKKLVKGVEARGDGSGEAVLARVDVSRTTQHHNKGEVYRAEIMLEIPGEPNMYVEATADNLHAAIDEVRDDLFREVKNSHKKHQTLVRRGARELKRRMRESDTSDTSE